MNTTDIWENAAKVVVFCIGSAVGASLILFDLAAAWILGAGFGGAAIFGLGLIHIGDRKEERGPRLVILRIFFFDLPEELRDGWEDIQDMIEESKRDKQLSGLRTNVYIAAQTFLLVVTLLKIKARRSITHRWMIK